jgi:CRISPR-associated exonuclease Cas4
MEDDELLVPLSALEHWSYCRRQCGLIHLENLWAESGHTAEGQAMHAQVDIPGMEHRTGQHLARALALRSDLYRLVGQADLVAFLTDPSYPDPGRPFPVEYKRGLRNTFRHAELQLCGQALCLEEMLGVSVPAGALYYGGSRRRREVPFTPDLRAETIEAIGGVLAMLGSQRTPPREAGAKCWECSLKDLCLPDLPDTPALGAYLEGMT